MADSTNNILFLDTPTGLAGDMLTAALLDLGADKEQLLAHLRRLPLDHWEMKEETVVTHGITGKSIEFLTEEGHIHRHLSDIFRLLDGADFPAGADAFIRRAFTLLAEAEAKVHGCSPEEIHFHEVGAMDSILDICSVGLLLQELHISEVYCTDLPLSSGTVRCAHGIMPVPAPAAAELLKGLRMKGTDLTGELITPTGAALLRAMDAKQTALPPVIITATGGGVGQRELPLPNMVRAMLCVKGDSTSDTVDIITANVDDCSGELLSALTAAVMDKGALDICYIPMTMKKGRPAWQIQIMTRSGQGEAFAQLLMEHTTTIGCRIREERRMVAERQCFTVNTPYGPVTMKKSGSTCLPENDSVAERAKACGVSWKAVYLAALKAEE